MADRPWKRRGRMAFLLVGFPLAAWFLMGAFGLVAGILIVALWWLSAPPSWLAWALSLAFLAAAPVALLLEGVPRTSVVGAQFGVNHIAAHRLVQVSVALAAFAALSELAGLAGRSRPAGSLLARIARAKESHEASGEGEPGASPSID